MLKNHTWVPSRPKCFNNKQVVYLCFYYIINTFIDIHRKIQKSLNWCGNFGGTGDLVHQKKILQSVEAKMALCTEIYNIIADRTVFFHNN